MAGFDYFEHELRCAKCQGELSGVVTGRGPGQVVHVEVCERCDGKARATIHNARPCPFCGEKHNFLGRYDGKIECRKCGAVASDRVWNTRITWPDCKGGGTWEQ